MTFCFPELLFPGPIRTARSLRLYFHRTNRPLSTASLPIQSKHQLRRVFRRHQQQQMRELLCYLDGHLVSSRLALLSPVHGPCFSLLPSATGPLNGYGFAKHIDAE